MEKKIFNNVKSIGLDIQLEGRGLVNYDGKEQISFIAYNAPGVCPSDYLRSNGKLKTNLILAKKDWVQIGEDENHKPVYGFRNKVSSDCIRHEMFSDTMPFQNPKLVHLDTLLYAAIAQPDYIARGYMFTNQGGNTVRKKSFVTIPDAIENETHTAFAPDFHSRTGSKLVKGDNTSEDDSKDTSVFMKETRGDIEFESKNGFIDLTEAQFISADVIFDRMAVDVDGGPWQEYYLENLARNFKCEKPVVGYYNMKDSYIKGFAEKGILLDKASVDLMVKRILRKILNINIVRKDARCWTKGLTITVNYEGGSDKVDVTLDNIDDFQFDYFQKYEPADEEQILENLRICKENEELVNAVKKNKKNEAKQKKAEAKAAATQD